MSDAFGHIPDEIATLRAEIERLTKERDEAQTLLSRTITDGRIVEAMVTERIAVWCDGMGWDHTADLIRDGATKHDGGER
ncbi:MAG: hypothetical protein M3619_00820 [Myxococcota bacterium]|nr:hypothetical protein [Myxococcota bacterium]